MTNEAVDLGQALRELVEEWKFEMRILRERDSADRARQIERCAKELEHVLRRRSRP